MLQYDDTCVYVRWCILSCVYVCQYVCTDLGIAQGKYGVATISRLLKIIGLFFKRAL